jgi:hypothetical protein
MVVGLLMAATGVARADTDPVGDVYNGLPTIDLNELAACQTTTDLVVRLGFTADVVLPSEDAPTASTVFGYVDFDLDRNAATADAPSHVKQFGSPGAGTEIGMEAAIDLPSYDGPLGVSEFQVYAGATSPVATTVAGSTITYVIPLSLLGGDLGVHVAAVIGTQAQPTDVAPNTGYVSSAVACCGNGTLEPGETCDGGCCAADCSGPDDAQCDDADPCFDDACDLATGCSHTDRTGFPGVTCAFERALPTLCAGATVDTTLTAKAKALVEQAASDAAKAPKRLRKAQAFLKKAVRKIQRLGKKGKLDPACADGLVVQLQDARSRIARLQ